MHQNRVQDGITILNLQCVRVNVLSLIIKPQRYILNWYNMYTLYYIWVKTKETIKKKCTGQATEEPTGSKPKTMTLASIQNGQINENMVNFQLNSLKNTED